MKFCPIINFNFGEHPFLDLADILIFYERAIKACAGKCSEIEISLASDFVFDNLEMILEEAFRHDVKVSFGSISSVELASYLLTNLEKHKDKNPGPFKVMAPAFDEKVYEFFKDKSAFIYVPAVFSQKDYDEILSYKIDLEFLKIYPFSISNEKSFLKSLQGPYPELRKLMHQKRTLVPTRDLIKKYHLEKRLQEKEIQDSTGKTIFVVSSPRDYQKIRSRFLLDPNTKILINFADQKIKLAAIDPSVKLVITGFSNRNLDIQFDESENVLLLASRVFNTISLDLLNGSTSMLEAFQFMQEELDEKILQVSKVK